MREKDAEKLLGCAVFSHLIEPVIYKMLVVRRIAVKIVGCL